MAAQTLTTTIHKTLSGTTADTITVASSTPQGIEILNRSTTSPLWVNPTWSPGEGRALVAEASAWAWAPEFAPVDEPEPDPDEGESPE